MDQEGATYARIVCHLAETAIVDALRKGVRVEETVAYVIHPDDTLWDRLFALDPKPIWDYDFGDPTATGVELEVGRVRGWKILNDEPTSLTDFLDELKLSAWSKPELEVEWIDSIAKLSTFPNVEEAIAIEEGLRQNFEEKLDIARRNDLEETMSRWRGWSQEAGRESAELLLDSIAAIDRDVLPHGSSLMLDEASKRLRLVISQANSGKREDDNDGLWDWLAIEVRENFEIVDQVRTAAAKEASRAKEMSEAQSWVAENGSPRLKKATMAGLLGSSMTVYREERLRAERPGWFWWDQSESSKAIVNPSEEALDALLEAKKSDSMFAHLAFSPRLGGAVVKSRYLGRWIAFFVSTGEEPF